ncbi:MAG: amino acid ABC transporter permease [Bacilli bacterium]|nr:amino acid ABC transporter permease [Bacilli bacterium]
MAYFVEILVSLLSGLKITLIIFVFTLTFSIPLGLLGAILKRSSFVPLVKILDAYTWVIRGTPLLLQLYFTVFGLPMLLGFKVDRMSMATLTFIINYTAYFIEIFRGGMNSIFKGQFEAYQVLGLSRPQGFLYIIIPQTLKKVLPTITNEAITLVKDTALVASVAIFDILKITQRIVSADIRFEAYVVAAFLYLGLSYGIVLIFRRIEKKYSFYH